jgi:hypothetical protein
MIMTTDALHDAAAQLQDEADTILAALAPLTGRHNGEISLQRCEHLIRELDSDNDRLAAEACLTVMTLLWPHTAPEDCQRADWWRTPLGRLCARSLGHETSDAITYAAAAAMLGIERGTVSVMVQRGTLTRHPDGGVDRAAVMARLGR